jgi:hypothetical protein
MEMSGHRPLYPWERTTVPIEKKVGRLHSRSGHFGKEKDVWPLLEYIHMIT